MSFLTSRKADHATDTSRKPIKALDLSTRHPILHHWNRWTIETRKIDLPLAWHSHVQGIEVCLD